MDYTGGPESLGVPDYEHGGPDSTPTSMPVRTTHPYPFNWTTADSREGGPGPPIQLGFRITETGLRMEEDDTQSAGHARVLELGSEIMRNGPG